MREKTCTSCGAPMLMVPTKASAGEREMPLDKEPAANGNVMVLKDGMATVLGGPLLQKAREDEDVTLYTSHHYTCPHASAHRRKRRG